METEYYWSIILEQGWVQAAIWTIEDKTARVIAVSPVMSWEAEEDLVENTNSALSAAVQNFPEDAPEPNKTVFGVPPSWVGEGQIKKEYLGFIREICGKLSLSPSGFVVYPEAIAHTIKLEEGSPLNGVVIGVAETAIDISIFNLGNLIGTVNVGRSVSVVEDVVEGLVRFGSTTAIPSRFLIYDGKETELEDIRQSLIQAEWTDGVNEKLQFLHTPKFEIVTPKAKAKSVCLAGASEIGEIVSVILSEGEKTQIPVEPESGDDSEIMAEDENLTEGNGLTPEDVGFVLGEDVRQMTHGNEGNTLQSDEVAAPELAFDPSVAAVAPARAAPKIANPFQQSAGPVAKIRRFLHKLKLPKIRLPLGRKLSLPAQSIPAEKSAKRMFAVFLGIIIFVCIGLFAAWWYYPKAEVTVFVSPRTLGDTIELTLDENLTDPDYQSRSLPASVVRVTVTGEKTGSATGNKTVGEKAKGQVTVRNGTATGVRLPSGTVITGPNDLKYSTEETASASAAESPSSPGTVTIAVVAEDIGSDYNLAKDSQFTVSNYPRSVLDAIAESDFTGGSSRDIVAVAQKDLDQLVDELENELRETGNTKFKSETAEGKRFIEEAVRVENTDESFNHKVGDEASTVMLTMSMDLLSIAVDENELSELARTLLSEKVPEGYTLRDDQIEISYDFKNEDEGKWSFDVRFDANLLPQVNPKDVSDKVAGKYPPQAKEYLKNTIPGFIRAEVVINPTLPGRLATIPRVQKNIFVEVESER